MKKEDLNEGGIWPAVTVDPLSGRIRKIKFSDSLEMVFGLPGEQYSDQRTFLQKTFDWVCGFVFLFALLLSAGCQRPAESQSVSVPIHTEMNWSPSTEEDWIDAHISVESGHFRLASKTEDWLCRKEGWKDRTWCASLGPAQIVFGYWHELCELERPEDLFDLRIARRCAKKIRRECAKRYTNNDFVSSCYNAGHITKRGMIYAAKVRKAYEKLRSAI